MDSVTQIVLGAAVGEVVLGKKAGNRAMLWGAVAGTIPDLDVVANFMTDEMTALAFHRGLTHSIFFAVVAPFAFAYVVNKIYENNLYKSVKYRGLGTTFWLGAVLVFMGLFNYVPVMASGNISMPVVAVTIGIFSLLSTIIWKGYYKKEPSEINTNYFDWVWLFFWATITHPLLDSCTAYGTQLFQPFNDYRVAFNTISVADPIYTVPFLICLIAASIYTRGRKARSVINWIGIGLSSAYLLFGWYHKTQVDRIAEAGFKRNNMEVTRYTTNPTILNNYLWNVVAEGDTAYYHAQLSLFDQPAEIGKFRIFPKNHHLIDQYKGDRTYEILTWFSDGYYNIIRRRDGLLQLNDMRFGTFGDLDGNEEDYIFKFILSEKNGELQAEQSRAGRQSISGTFKLLIARISGIKPDMSPGFKTGPPVLK